MVNQSPRGVACPTFVQRLPWPGSHPSRQPHQNCDPAAAQLALSTDDGARRCSRDGGRWFWGGGGGCDEPVRNEAMIVCDWGPRFPASHVTVCRQGRSATETTHDQPKVRPAWCAW